MADRYSFERKIELLLLLRTNNFNFVKTNKDTGVAVSTLRKWRKEFGKGIYEAGILPMHDPLKQQEAEVFTEGKDVRDKMNALAIQVLDIAKVKLADDAFLKKMSPKDLGVLIKEVIPFIIPKFEGGDKDNKNYTQVFNNFVTNTYNQLIQSGHEQRNNSIKGATKKLSGGNE